MKKLLSFLLILVGAMIFAIPGQSYADPQLDTLLNIATQARDNLGTTISQINDVPDEINQLYSQGSNETDALAEAINQQDANSAKQHFLAAMKFFKETNDQINSLNATSSNNQQKAEIVQLRGEVARLTNMGILLKSIASENNISINFTNFDKMIQSANQDLDSGNSDDASKQLENANNFVVATHDSLTNIAQERISEREKSFAENQIVRLNHTNQLNVTQNIMPVNSSHAVSITNNSSVTIPATNSYSITVGSNPKDMVAELKQLVSEGKVDQAINLIKIIQAYQKAQSAEKPMEASSPTNSTTPIPIPPPVPSSPTNSTAPIPIPPPVPSSPTNSTTPIPIPPPVPSSPTNSTAPIPIPPPVPSSHYSTIFTYKFKCTKYYISAYERDNVRRYGTL
ncbi:hypothetical protein DYY67_1521 [Candidatus Nitrosotalea sp. TS]|uniref:hypothetical protein n=1 Tax=Candidatus Nitrosotalea sp. TS TaxID=2341020 RepID=UPI00140DE592|nr:hypothetical protein [Candidatus Nitrosotalea sp. TS]NHI04146.1 hypothetical protein [Candidatus Nitrosotalea sp. TS]